MRNTSLPLSVLQLTQSHQIHNDIYKTSLMLSLPHVHPAMSITHTHTHRESSHSSKQWGRSDSDIEAPCIYRCNYHCRFLSVCPSLCVFSSPSIMQPSSLCPLLLSTVWTRPFCPYTLMFYPTIPSLFPLRFPLSFSLIVTSRKLQSDSRICPSWLRLAGWQTVCLSVSFKKLIIHSSKSLCLCLPFVLLCYLTLFLPASCLYNEIDIKI